MFGCNNGSGGWNPCVVAAFATLGLLVAAPRLLAQSKSFSLFDSTGAAPERPANEPPSYNILRYEEDYSYLRDPSKRTDLFDPLKFIPLDADGFVYLTLGGDMRQRFEHYSGFGLGNGSVDGKANSYYLARYLLYLDLQVGEAFRFFFQAKSNTELGRRDGARPGIDRDDFDVHQAFFDVRLPLGKATQTNAGATSASATDTPPAPSEDTTLLIRLGRQELAYGADRLIDIREGPNVRQSFDAARISLENTSYKVDAFYARQVATNKGIFDDGYDLNQAILWGVYSTIDLPFLRRPNSGDVPQIDLYYLGFDRQNAAFNQSAARTGPLPVPGHETRHSVGGRVHGKVFPLGDGLLTGEFHYDVEGLYQFGTFGDADISAWGMFFDLGYYFKALPFGPNVSLRYDLTSGDSHRGDGTLGTFNPLFPRGAYFSEPGFIGPNNLIVLHPVIDWHLHKALGLSTTVLGYWRQDTGDGIYNEGGFPSMPGAPNAQLPAGANVPGGARFVGTEANALMEWGINRHLTFDLSYSHFFAGSYARDLAAFTHTPGGRDGQSFDYVAAWLTFTF